MNLIQPNTVFLDYKNQFDMRIAKNFRFGTNRIQGFADIFNVLERRHRAARQRGLRPDRHQRVDDAD